MLLRCLERSPKDSKRVWRSEEESKPSILQDSWNQPEYWKECRRFVDPCCERPKVIVEVVEVDSMCQEKKEEENSPAIWKRLKFGHEDKWYMENLS